MPLAFVFAAALMTLSGYYSVELHLQRKAMLEQSEADAIAASMLAYSRQLAECITGSTDDTEVYARYQQFLSYSDGTYGQFKATVCPGVDEDNIDGLVTYEPFPGIGMYLDGDKVFVHYSSEGTNHSISHAGLQRALRDRTKNSLRVGAVRNKP